MEGDGFSNLARKSQAKEKYPAVVASLLSVSNEKQ
jgi:hypothetical protein